MKRIITELIILFVIGSLLWAAFAFIIKLPRHPVLISKEHEMVLGEKYREAILKLSNFQKVEDIQIDSILANYAEKLSSVVENDSFLFKIIIVNSELINAFALPGGNIILTTGLIQFCDSTEELVAVLAHEAGHIVERHLISRLIKEIGISILNSDDNFVIGEITKGIISSGYDRKQEEEADLFSCNLLNKAGMEPRILASFLRRLKESENQDLFKNFEIFSSHPDIDKRIRDILLFKGENFNLPLPFPAIRDLKKIVDQKNQIN